MLTLSIVTTVLTFRLAQHSTQVLLQEQITGVGSSISYSSSSNGVFTVDKNGVITPVAKGTATLTTTITGGSYGDTYSVTTKISVTPASTDPIDTPIVTNL